MLASPFSFLILFSIKHIVFAIFYGLSLLPFWVLYRLSDFAFVILYHLVGYRKELVMSNLSRSFPRKSEAELKKIRRQFFRHLCDWPLEAIKGFSLSEKAFSKRMKFLNPEVMDEIAAHEKGTAIMAAHYGNLEWQIATVDMYKGSTPAYTIYQRIKSPVFEHIMRKMRTRHGTDLIEMRTAYRASLRILQKSSMIGFASDQSPRTGQKTGLYFTQLLGQATAMQEGASTLCVRGGFNAYYLDMKKLKRGYYTLEFVRIPVEDFETAHDFTDHYAQLVEKSIRAAPAYWLWSHRRWKHQEEVRFLEARS